MNIKNLSNSLLAGAALGLATALNALSPQVAQAEVGAVIFNNADPSLASVALGVNDAGHLNFSDPLGFSPVNAGATGLSYRFTDGTWPIYHPSSMILQIFTNISLGHILQPNKLVKLSKML